MKKLALSFLFLTVMITSFVSLEASSSIPYYCEDDYMGPPPYDCSIYDDQEYIEVEAIDDYDRIYKLNGIWYGVINVEDILLLPPVNNDGPNSISVKLSRETTHLTSITYDFITVDHCDGTGLNNSWGCIGTFIPSYSDNETVYERDRNGLFNEYIFGNNAGIKTSSSSDYDYEIFSDTHITFKSVEVVTFTYVLTNVEVDNVMANIQTQYNQEYNYILNHPDKTDTEKNALIQALNAEYAEYEITYGEELTSPCVGDECYTEHPEVDNSLNTIWEWLSSFLDDYASWAINNLLSAIVFLILGGVFIKALAQAIVSKAFEAGTSVIGHMFNGLVAIVSIFFTTLFTGVFAIFDYLLAGITALLSIFTKK